MEDSFNGLGVGIAFNRTHALVYGESNAHNKVPHGIVTASMITLGHIPGGQVFGLLGGGWAVARLAKKKKVCKAINTRIGVMKFFMEYFSSWIERDQ